MLWSLCLYRLSGLEIGVRARQRFRSSSFESFPVGFAADENNPVFFISVMGPCPSRTVTGSPPGRPYRTSWVISSQAFVSATSAAMESGAPTKKANDTNNHPLALLIDISIILPKDLLNIKINKTMVERIPYFGGKNHGLCSNY